MMRKLTSVMFFRLVSVIVTHCSDATAKAVALSLATPGSTVGRPCSGSTGASSAPPAGEEVGEVEEEEEELLQGPACAKKPKQ